MPSRWFTLAVSGVVLVAGFALRPAAADVAGEDVGKEVTCPVMGTAFKVTKSTKYATVNGQPVYFCCAGCTSAFAKEPEKYLAKVDLPKCPIMPASTAKASKSLRVL